MFRGFINSFGIFQAYYSTSLDRPPSNISWIGSIQVFLLFFIGTFTGRLTDAGYFRALFVTGTALQVLGLFVTAQATVYWQVFLAQGVCMGLGNGCLFCPAIAVLSTYFSKRKSLAIGLAACGSATGGLIYPSIVRQLLPRVGLAWTLRCMGFIQLVTLVLANAGLRPRVPPRKKGRIVEWAAFREVDYALYAVAAFFVSSSLSLPTYSRDTPETQLLTSASLRPLFNTGLLRRVRRLLLPRLFRPRHTRHVLHDVAQPAADRQRRGRPRPHHPQLPG